MTRVRRVGRGAERVPEPELDAPIHHDPNGLPPSVDPTWAWMQHLPADDQQLMMQELRETRTKVDRDQLLHEWRVTAEALSDPIARDVLLGNYDLDDGG